LCRADTVVLSLPLLLIVLSVLWGSSHVFAESLHCLH
jgi:hypothetical protein